MGLPGIIGPGAGAGPCVLRALWLVMVKGTGLMGTPSPSFSPASDGQTVSSVPDLGSCTMSRAHRPYTAAHQGL